VPDATFPELETKRLRLREITMDDAAWYLSHFSLPEIACGQGFPAPADIGVARDELARFIVDLRARGEGLRWGISLKGEDTLIGSAGFYDWDRRVGSAEMGYDLRPAFWGRGVMTEAATAILDHGFDGMGLNRVQVLVMPRNERSLGLAGRLGFVREGVLRDHGLDETRAVCDDVVLSLLRRESARAARRRDAVPPARAASLPSAEPPSREKRRGDGAPKRVFPELATERLRLREITMDDADWLLAYRSTPEIVYGQGFPAPEGIDDARDELRRYIVEPFARDEGLRWGIALRGADALVGSAGFDEWDREVGSAELDYDLAPEYWGRGIMTEALTAILSHGFSAMALNRVQLMVMPRNARSLGLAGRLGFVREAVLRGHGLDETGAVCDDVALSLLRREWKPADSRDATA
jgi:ribosomal-protein-alanine N-acetyltransferase